MLCLCIKRLYIECVFKVNGGNRSKSTSKSPVVFPPIKGDVAVRQKCREMIESSLKPEESTGQSLYQELQDNLSTI